MKVRKLERVSWQRVTAINIESLKPPWAFAFTPQRVYTFMLDDVSEVKRSDSRKLGWSFRRGVKLYGTPLVFPETLVRQSESDFDATLRRYSDVPVVRTVGTPPKASYLDQGLGGGVVGGVGVSVGVIIGLNSKVATIHGAALVGVLVLLDVGLVMLWRHRLRRLRTSQ